MAEQSSNTWNEGAGGAGPTGTAGSTPSTGATGGSSTKSSVKQKVASTVASAADTQKNRAADSLGGIADAARQTSEDLRGQNEMLASWVNAASDQLRTMADRLRDRPAAELADDLTRFAQQRPAVFLGGAFLLGLGVARLLKASPQYAYSGGGNGGGMSAGMHGTGEYEESGMGGSVSGTGDSRTGGTWSPSGGGY